MIPAEARRPDVSVHDDGPGLKKVLGPGLLLLFIVGGILGTGVYALTSQVVGKVGGAALYAHKAFGIHFVTFLVAFAVLCSGITSATTAAGAPGIPFGVIFPYLTIFAVVNAAVLILRKDPNGYGGGSHFRTPVLLPWIGGLTSLFLVGPWARLDALIQYQIAGALLGIGVLLRAFEWLYNRGRYGKSTRFRNPEELG